MGFTQTPPLFLHSSFLLFIVPSHLSSGAPVTNLAAVVLNSTAISLSWTHPPSHLTPTLSSYLLQYTVSGSLRRETLVLDMSVTSVLLTRLEEATQYQLCVFGDYGDVQGVVVTVTATTEEDGTPHSSSCTRHHKHKFGTFYTPLTVNLSLCSLFSATHSVPTSAPRNVSLDGEVEALKISWLVCIHDHTTLYFTLRCITSCELWLNV